MKDAASLSLAPREDCGRTEQDCPLMRVCACCGSSFPTARGRRQHQNNCRSVMDVVFATAQHDHLVAVHRVRPRRGRTRG